MFPHFLVAIADLTHPLSNNRSSVRIIGCYWLTSCKSAELVSRSKIVRREPERDGKILSDPRQDGDDEVHRL